jgi:hypothetical protein
MGNEPMTFSASSRDTVDGSEERAKAKAAAVVAAAGAKATTVGDDDIVDDDIVDDDTRRRSQRQLFTVVVVVPGGSSKLGMGITELTDGTIAVSKIEKGAEGAWVGPAELTGLRLNDRLIGAFVAAYPTIQSRRRLRRANRERAHWGKG